MTLDSTHLVSLVHGIPAGSSLMHRGFCRRTFRRLVHRR